MCMDGFLPAQDGARRGAAGGCVGAGVLQPGLHVGAAGGDAGHE